MTALSIIIPVYQEATIINPLIASLKRQTITSSGTHSTEIIVVDGDPARTTLNQINDPSVICLHCRQGRARQMNHGASHATGTNLFFLHADSSLPPNALTTIHHTLANPAIAAGAFDLGIDTSSRLLKLIEKSAALRSRLTRIPYGDQGLFLPKSVFKNMGGFSEIPLMEDIDMMLKLKKKGVRIEIVREKIFTSPRKWEEQGILYCSVRNILLSGLFYLGVDAEVLVKFY